jgi:hypothetical protein
MPVPVTCTDHMAPCTHLNRCRFASEQSQPQSLGMSGAVDEDVDAIDHAAVGDFVVGHLRSIAPVLGERAEFLRDISGLAVVL